MSIYDLVLHVSVALLSSGNYPQKRGGGRLMRVFGS